MLQWWWQQNYAPCLVDQIKWNYFFDEDFLEQTKAEFIKTWISMGSKNPVTYVRAYLMETHGYWKPGVQDWYGYIQFIPEEINNVDRYGIRMRDEFKQIFGFSIAEPIENIKGAIGSGTLFWVITGFMLLTIIKRRRGAWIAYVPALANWLCIMIAAPAAYGLRYVFVFALGLPVYLFLPFICSKKD